MNFRKKIRETTVYPQEWNHGYSLFFKYNKNDKIDLIKCVVFFDRIRDFS